MRARGSVRACVCVWIPSLSKRSTKRNHGMRAVPAPAFVRSKNDDPSAGWPAVCFISFLLVFLIVDRKVNLSTFSLRAFFIFFFFLLYLNRHFISTITIKNKSELCIISEWRTKSFYFGFWLFLQRFLFSFSFFFACSFGRRVRICLTHIHLKECRERLPASGYRKMFILFRCLFLFNCAPTLASHSFE